MFPSEVTPAGGWSDAMGQTTGKLPTASGCITTDGREMTTTGNRFHTGTDCGQRAVSRINQHSEYGAWLVLQRDIDSRCAPAACL